MPYYLTHVPLVLWEGGFSSGVLFYSSFFSNNFLKVSWTELYKIGLNNMGNKDKFLTLSFSCCSMSLKAVAGFHKNFLEGTAPFMLSLFFPHNQYQITFIFLFVFTTKRIGELFSMYETIK